MIRCEKCNELISDKSTNCVHCGYPVKSNHRICKECGNIIGEDEKTCHFCGCPVKKDWFGLKRNKLIILLVLVLFVGAAVGIGKYTENKRIEAQKLAAVKKRKEYKNNLNLISSTMISSAVDAEKCGNKIKAVWYNCIFEKSDPETDEFTKHNGVFRSDFNDALSALFADSSYSELSDGVEQTQSEVTTMMNKMKNPPKEYAEAYDTLKTLYDDYLSLTNMVVNPSGSYETFSKSFTEADTLTAKDYKKIAAYIN